MTCRRCGSTERRPTRNACAACDRRGARDRMQARRKDVATSLWENARTRARKNGLPFTITVEDVRAVWPQDARCPALGLRMQRGRGVMRAASPTLDRLVPAFGYVPGNIAVLCAKANIAKSAATAEELRRIAAWMNLAGLN